MGARAEARLWAVSPPLTSLVAITRGGPMENLLLKLYEIVLSFSCIKANICVRSSIIPAWQGTSPMRSLSFSCC